MAEGKDAVYVYRNRRQMLKAFALLKQVPNFEQALNMFGYSVRRGRRAGSYVVTRHASAVPHATKDSVPHGQQKRGER